MTPGREDAVPVIKTVEDFLALIHDNPEEAAAHRVAHWMRQRYAVYSSKASGVWNHYKQDTGDDPQLIELGGRMWFYLHTQNRT